MGTVFPGQDRSRDGRDGKNLIEAGYAHTHTRASRESQGSFTDPTDPTDPATSRLHIVGDRLVRAAELARVLGVSDRQVNSWWSRNSTNGFPDPVACNFGNSTKGGKRRHMLWNLDSVLAWHASYDPNARRGQHFRDREAARQAGLKSAAKRANKSKQSVSKPEPRTPPGGKLDMAKLRERMERVNGTRAE